MSKFQIKYNCPESLGDMTKTGCGFYCESCKKEIFDFRGMSYPEIVALKSTRNIQCGVLDSNMARESIADRVKLIFRVAFAAVFILGFNANILFGQTRVNYTEGVTTERVSENEILIKGTVYNHKNKPIKATVSYYYNSELIKTETNEDGQYEIRVSKEIIAQGIYFYLTFSAEEMEAYYANLGPGDGNLYIVDAHLEKYDAKKHKHDGVRGYF